MNDIIRKKIEEFKTLSSDFIQGKLSPIALDSWLTKALEEVHFEGVLEGMAKQQMDDNEG